ncbi:MAG: glycosyltransferase [Candidatus Parcubacteria bacterium]|nr:glycosyltransferase [Candidatus Parcubacteria bacterium]
MSKIYLSVVIPSYDEMANLQKGVLDKVEHFLSKEKFSYEVIIVDDGSTDGSVEFVESFTKDNSRFRIIKNQHLGKAGAVTTGVLKASGEYILFTDMDQATPIEEIDKLLFFFDRGLPAGRQGFDVLIGSRKNQRKGAPFTRLIMARGMILLRTVIVGIHGISDTQCGFKMFKKDVAKKIFEKINNLHHGFRKVTGSSVSAGFDIELLYLAQKMGYKIKEVPVNWLYVETRRVSPLKDSIEGFLDLLKIKINDIRGKYE